MDKLKTLIERCKCGVYLTINDHRNIHQSVTDALFEYASEGFEIATEVQAEIVETDTLIDLQFYPDTPVGSYRVIHYDLDLALNEALKALNIPWL
jgi:hypothetical protein